MRARHSTYEYSDPLTSAVVFYEKPVEIEDNYSQIRVYFTRTVTRHYLTGSTEVFFTHRSDRLYFDGEMAFHPVAARVRPAWFGPETYMDPEFVPKMNFALAQMALRKG